MSESCKHCNNGIEYNFCAHCGQRRLKRIDRNYIKDELQYTVLHMNKGFLFSIKSLIKGPGKTARAFIEGDRVNHYKPILLVFVLSGIAAFLSIHWVDAEDLLVQYYAENNIKAPYDVVSFYKTMMKYYSAMFLAGVPLVAFVTWLTFRKWGHNYYEHIIINSYFLSYFLIFNIIIVIPLQVLLKGNVNLFVIIPSIITFVLMIAQALIFFIGFYHDRDLGQVILKLFYTALIGMAVYLILSILLGIVFAMYMISNGIKPENVMGTVPVVKDSIRLLVKL